MKLGTTAVLALAGVAAVGVIGLWAWKKGGLVNAAGAVVSGAVDTASEVIGIPTTQQTTTDAEVARWIIDNLGQFEASKWAGAPAYLRAQFMAPGTGKPPPSSSPAGQALLPLVASYDETERLLARYPTNTAPDAVYTGGLTVGEYLGFPL